MDVQLIAGAFEKTKGFLEKVFGNEKAKDIIEATNKGNQEIIAQLLSGLKDHHESEKKAQYEILMLLLRYILEDSKEGKDKLLYLLYNQTIPPGSSPSKTIPVSSQEVTVREIPTSPITSEKLGGSEYSQYPSKATNEQQDADYAY